MNDDEELNSNEENFSVDTEQLKNETKDTVNQVKDSIKNSDFKKDAEDTKGYLKEMLSNPFETVRKVASEEENILPKAIIIMIVFIAASVIIEVISLIKYGKYSNIGENLLDLVASVLNPIFYVGVPAVIILIMNKNNKKSLITYVTTLITANIPSVVAKVLAIITAFGTKLNYIISPLSSTLSAISIVIVYFGMKELFGEEENKDFIKKFVIVEVIAFYIFKILTIVGLY